MVVVPPEIVDAIKDHDDAPALARWLDASPDRTVDDMDNEPENCYTLLMVAAEGSAVECTKFLLARGAQINLCGEHGSDTALHVASYYCFKNNVGTKLVDLLLDAGANVHVRSGRLHAHSADQTPLGIFLSQCRFPTSLDVVAILGTFLRAGAAVDAVSGTRSAEDALSRRLVEPPPGGLFGVIEPPPGEGESNLLKILASYRAAGCSWKAYKRGPHMTMLALRSLRSSGRASTTPSTSPYVDRLTSPDLPSGVAWKILEYWRATD